MAAFSVEISMDILSGSCLFGDWTLTVNNVIYPLTLVAPIGWLPVYASWLFGSAWDLQPGGCLVRNRRCTQSPLAGAEEIARSLHLLRLMTPVFAMENWRASYLNSMPSILEAMDLWWAMAPQQKPIFRAMIIYFMFPPIAAIMWCWRFKI